MKRNNTIHKDFTANTSFLDDIITNYDTKGENFGNQDRNSLKLYDLEGMTINVKSFKIPNIVNQIAYRFFRKSKAQRSYEYANRLLELGIGTPQPIAFYEYKTPLLFKKSYYISAHLAYDLTYRELTFDFDIPNYGAILRAFTRFTFELHEAGVNFLDHSPGNTLIQLNGGDYKFYLVDLNRMEFGDLEFETRIKNFARLTTHKSMVEVMSDEYAKLSGYNYEKVFKLMWGETEAFQERFHRKRRIKNKIMFWRKKK
ncbi:lipopolysaccharide kinase InaA family protein [Oceanihabitans sediminis]|uniref:Kdo domain containing protein n=1 Tax=Oceanihabitans sediminis TaxID=1812012 RepID=A0A368P314_9FLAO|nr:lipopolysaccharide kinase InaA family protein [Oceanihabitans sediminis]MDX1277993.1 lipopolysaccharide kinase InaA family protein [Oceanihabitans sediminis]MDX1774098.1 lipopolysaccharide kinase InaA family protein [Oceanihabitans sediminis]RBP30861.1 lipopolysaccharide kinase (Kdo/WaaP) family protein [Oceanihabitans sediminis]RCU56826.1 Kdo domain containing protein [Oceanihabitans sediminis]